MAAVAIAVDTIALMDALKIERRRSLVSMGRADGRHHRGALAGTLARPWSP